MPVTDRTVDLWDADTREGNHAKVLREHSNELLSQSRRVGKLREDVDGAVRAADDAKATSREVLEGAMRAYAQMVSEVRRLARFSKWATFARTVLFAAAAAGGGYLYAWINR